MKLPAPANTRPYRRLSESGPEMRTTTPDAEQLWRQVGWLGQTGAFYALDEKPSDHEGGSWGPLWALVDNEPPIDETAWNGEPCIATRVTAIVADTGFFPGYWAREYVGTRRKAVCVQYAGRTFYIDDEDGSGWHKVTHGGGPGSSHKDLDVEAGSAEPSQS